MYIQKAEIKNIRAIIDFEIEFKNPAGWHVLIGDNGAGKSTIIRSMALALVRNEASGLRENWSNWLSFSEDSGQIKLFLEKEFEYDSSYQGALLLTFINSVTLTVSFRRFGNDSVDFAFSSYGGNTSGENLTVTPPITKNGNFSVAYGPYRRFEGGSRQWLEVFENPSLANLSAHLSVFGEDVALIEATNWLVGLFNTSNDSNFPKEQAESNKQLENIKKLINWEEDSQSFLPNNTKLESVNSKGVFFKDAKGTIISINQMSDGYRSILSMTFELIRQLVLVYGSELVFKNIEKGEMSIDLPGVVLVDEIDAHLHPTWQTRIGQWFLKYFPKLQFIVTTHSPLVCRAAETGSIWRLAAPGSDEKSGEVTGIDRERLIYGNILDAYGTEVFGEDVSISHDSVEKQEELVKLSKKKMLDAISPEEEEKLQDLKKVFTTDAPIEL
jgi:predicted ATP-binding protein involved in virulence